MKRTGLPVADLLRTQAKQDAYVPLDAWYQFRVAPSCPPDKRLFIRGGTPLYSQLHGDMTYEYNRVDDLTCDFENQDETQLALNFTHSGYYLSIILCLYSQWLSYHVTNPDSYGEPVFDNVEGTEVATSAEAEQQIDSFMNGSEQWFYYRMPLVGVVFRNDGITGEDYAILPIDACNRGRSYIYRDLRSWGGIMP